MNSKCFKFIYIVLLIHVCVSTFAFESNASHTLKAEKLLFPPAVITVIEYFLVAGIIISLIGIFINACNSYIICKLPDVGGHFKLILSLAMADLCLCLSDLFMLGTYAFNKYSYGDVGQIREGLCVWAFNDCLQFMAFLATLFSVIMIAVDCFLKTKIPLRYRVIVTKKRINIVVSLSWISAFVISMLACFWVWYIAWLPREYMSSYASLLSGDKHVLDRLIWNSSYWCGKCVNLFNWSTHSCGCFLQGVLRSRKRCCHSPDTAKKDNICTRSWD